MSGSAAETHPAASFITSEELLRRPLRQVLAIDPENPYEIDDAIRVTQIKPNSCEYRVEVHIADGGLLYGSPLVDKARAQGWSRYLDDQTTIPMLPAEVSKQALSLDRGGKHGAPSVAVAFEFNSGSRDVGNVDVFKSRVACEGITYDEFGRRVRKHNREAVRLKNIAKKLQEPQGEKQSFSFPRMAEEVVGKFMVTANIEIAKKMESEGLPWLFRNHSEGAYQGLKSRAERDILRQLRVAQYGRVATRHEGLGIAKYCHFTSPLRRFADLVNHLTLHASMEKLDAPFTEEEIDKIAVELTALHIRRSRHLRAKVQASRRQKSRNDTAA